VVAAWESDMRDFSFLEERKAKVMQVTRKRPAKKAVALTKKTLVLAPKRDSAEEKASVKPPPRPDCSKIIAIRKRQTPVCKKMTKPILDPPFGNQSFN